MYLQFYPSGKDIRDKTYEQVANIFANVAPLQKISIDFMRNVPVNLRQNIQIGQPPPQNCFGYCPECPNLFDCGTPQLLKKYMRHRKNGKHAKGLNLSCDNCGMVLKSNYHYDVHRRICDQNIGENFVILERVNVNSKLHNILKKLNPSEFYNAVNEDSISMEGFWPPLFISGGMKQSKLNLEQYGNPRGGRELITNILKERIQNGLSNEIFLLL